MATSSLPKPYITFDDSMIQNMTIYRMQLQAHTYVLIKQSILYLSNLYNTVTEELHTLSDKPRKENAAFEAFGSGPVTKIDYLFSPMTEEYWEQKSEVSVGELQETERKTNEFFAELRRREAEIRAEVLKQKELMNKALDENDKEGNDGGAPWKRGATESGNVK